MAYPETNALSVGQSMLPLLQAGDRPRHVPLSGTPNVGWIVSIVSKGRHVTHRVVKVNGERFWTRGDAALEMEGPFMPREALGRVVGFWRDGKYHRLDRRIDDFVGLASNHAQNWLRRAARRLPRLKRALAEKDLGSPALSSLAIRLLRLGCDEIEVSRERLHPPPAAKNGPGGASWVFVARCRLGRVGEVALDRVAGLEEPATGYVSALAVGILYRRLGVGRRLLGAVEREAMREGLGRLGALVRKDNAASQALFASMGYRRVPPDEIARRDDLAPLAADMDLFEKSIVDIGSGGGHFQAD